jgi:hypothetical protein
MKAQELHSRGGGVVCSTVHLYGFSDYPYMPSKLRARRRLIEQTMGDHGCAVVIIYDAQRNVRRTLKWMRFLHFMFFPFYRYYPIRVCRTGSGMGTIWVIKRRLWRF